MKRNIKSKYILLRILWNFIELRVHWFADAGQTRKLVQDLQRFAKESGHKKPLLIGIDQENGIYVSYRLIAVVLMCSAHHAGLVAAFSSPTAGTQLWVKSILIRPICIDVNRHVT